MLDQQRPRVTLGELHLEAMRLLVAALEKKKFAVTERPRQRGVRIQVEPSETKAPRQRVAAAEVEQPEAKPSRRRGAATEGVESETKAPDRRRGRSRYIPADVRREVYRRDGGCCKYVDGRGRRCRETHYLELHHILPFAKNGASVASNLTLRCAAHNALAAEQDFGPTVIAKRHSSIPHEALSAQGLVEKPRPR
jgi:5-methylcytosine-specific restriction endonuclease McrA